MAGSPAGREHWGLEAVGAEHPKETAHPSGCGDSLEHGLCPAKLSGWFYFSAPRWDQLPPCSLEMLHPDYLGIHWEDRLPFPSLIPIFHDTSLAVLPSEPGSRMPLCVISAVHRAIDQSQSSSALDPYGAAQGGEG